MTGDLQGRVVLVTGAGGRLGRATVKTMHELGATVVGSDVDAQTLSAAMEPLGAGHLSVVADLADTEAARGLVHRTVDEMGRIDVPVNNGAVLAGGGPVTECPQSLFDQIMAVNVRAPFYMIAVAIPAMLEAGGGVIINVSSVLAQVGSPGQSAYTASKGAIHALTRQVSVDFASRGIRCLAVCPGSMVLPDEYAGFSEDLRRYIDSLHTVARPSHPEEVSAVIGFLATDRASFVHGAAINVDGGFTAM